MVPRRSRFAIIPLALYVLSATMLGCTNQKTPYSDLKISPNGVELGTIASTGQQVVGKFTLTNSGSREMACRLRPSCSCTILDKSDFTLGPAESREVSLSLSSYGRSGDFHTEILVDTPDETLKVPLKAVFLPQVSVFPSRMVLHATEKEVFSGEIRVDAPKELWLELQLCADEPEELQEVESGSETRRFRLISKRRHREYPPIVLKKRGQETPVLSIPVFQAAP